MFSASVWAVSFTRSEIDVKSVFTYGLQVLVVKERNKMKLKLPCLFHSLVFLNCQEREYVLYILYIFIIAF